MFEATLLSAPTQRSRWIIAASLLLQTAFVAALIVVPLLYPATLPPVTVAPKMMAISLLKRPEPKHDVPRPHPLPAAQANTLHAPSTAAPRVLTAVHGRTIAHVQTATAGDVPPALPFGSFGGTNSLGNLPGVGSGTANAGAVVVAVATPARHDGPVRVSSGVSAGMLLAPITPVYPRMAAAMRAEGTVIVTAVIDKQGRIINLQVVSGPPVLRNAAMEAVAAARYKPYELNGSPTEVITTISVNFHLNS